MCICAKVYREKCLYVHKNVEGSALPSPLPLTAYLPPLPPSLVTLACLRVLSSPFDVGGSDFPPSLLVDVGGFLRSHCPIPVSFVKSRRDAKIPSLQQLQGFQDQNRPLSLRFCARLQTTPWGQGLGPRRGDVRCFVVCWGPRCQRGVIRSTRRVGSRTCRQHARGTPALLFSQLSPNSKCQFGTSCDEGWGCEFN